MKEKLYKKRKVAPPPRRKPKVKPKAKPKKTSEVMKDMGYGEPEKPKVKRARGPRPYKFPRRRGE